MNRIAKRSGIVVLIALFLIGGFSFFVAEYFAKSSQWVVEPGSLHVYSENNLNFGVVVDRDSILLLDMRDGRTYSQNAQLRKSILHWVGDRNGKIQAPALSHYAAQMSNYDVLGGVYTYGDTAGVAELTFSSKVQQAALEALGKRNGTVAVYNYKTGQILCAVTTPTFDPDAVPQNIEDGSVYDAPYWNRFTQSAYIPGSIFKTVTLAAAIEEIPDFATKVYNCTGTYQMGGEEDVIPCAIPHGNQTVKTAFSNSCNCVFAQIAQELGSEVMERYVDRFGVTKPVRFDGITTASGNYETSGEPIFLARSAIGQHLDQINPCAFLVYMGAIAGGGSGAQPYVVEKVTVGDKITYSASTVLGEQIMTAQTAEIMAQYMRNNVTSNYGDWNFPGLSVCAKTGTAEVGGDKKPNATFSGFVQDEQYPLAFMICVEDSGYGSDICVPIASKVLAACKEVLDAG